MLLDTTKEATLEWTRYPYGPQAQTPGVSINCECNMNSVWWWIRLINSGLRNRSRTLAKASIGAAMSYAMLHTTMWIIGSGLHSSIAAPQIVCILKSSLRFVTALYFPATHYHAKKHSACCSTSSMQLLENRPHGNRKATNWLVSGALSFRIQFVDCIHSLSFDGFALLMNLNDDLIVYADQFIFEQHELRPVKEDSIKIPTWT